MSELLRATIALQEDTIERLTADNKWAGEQLIKSGIEIERLHEAMQEMRDRYSAKCARVETLEGVREAANAVILYGDGSVTETNFQKLEKALAATEQESET